MKAYLGIDCGSVSIKMVCIDENNKILSSVYLRNKGLIETIKEGLKKIKEASNGLEIYGVGVTGSGREFTKILVGADLVKTEILAHSIATLTYYPGVKTIFDIGGEDCKIITINDGVMSNFVMNSICLTSDTLITTGNLSPKPINQLKKKDLVLTNEGNFEPIENIYSRDYNKLLLNISCGGLRKVRLTPEHPVFGIKRKDICCYNSHTRNHIYTCKPLKKALNKKCEECNKEISFEPSYFPASELEKKDFIAVPVPQQINNLKYLDFNTPERQILEKVKKVELTPSLLKVLGYYLAEGNIVYCLSRGKSRKKCDVGIGFTFNIKEEPIVNEIIQILNKMFDIRYNVKKNPEHSTIHLNVFNKSLCRLFKYLCGEKAAGKSINPILLNLSPLLQLELIKGLFIGDGFLRDHVKYSRKNRSYKLTTISADLASQAYWMLIRNKIKCGIYKDKSLTKGGFECYRIGIYGDDIFKLKKKISKSLRNESSSSFIYSKWLFIPIKDIRKEKYRGKVYNLKIKKDNSYIANFLAVHNCGAGTGAVIDSIASRLGIKTEDVGDLALKHKTRLNFPGKCGIFATSAVVSRLNSGADKSDILMGVCRGLINNYLTLAKNIKLDPPYVFQGATAKNKALIKILEEELKEKVTVPENCELMGAIGIAMLVKDEKIEKTSFRGFDISKQEFKTKNFLCGDCSNNCEVTQIMENGNVLGAIGSRCGKWNK